MFRNGDTWRVKWREAGKQRTRSFPTKEDAALFEAQLRKGVSTHRTLEQEQLTFAKWADRWFREYAQIEKSETTWSNDQSVIRMHLNPLLGEKHLIDIRKSDGQALKSAISEKGVKPKTVNNALQLAKKILAVACDYEIIPANPFQNVKPLKVPGQAFRYWTEADSSKFLQRCKIEDPEFHDLVLFAIRTGLRLGEIHALTRSDLDFENEQVRVGATYSIKLSKKLERTKNGEIGFVPMTPAVREVLLTKKLMRPDQTVFRQALVHHSREKLIRLCKKYQVPVLTFHDLRHTYASQLAMAGVDLYQIQKFMRHKSIDMTQRYAHLHPSSLKGKTDILDGTHLVRETVKNAVSN